MSDTPAVVLAPHARAFLDMIEALGEPQYDKMPLAKTRALMNDGMKRLGGAAESVARVDDLAIPGPHGAIPIRVYVPHGSGPFGVVAFYHGGGFVIGGLDEYDATVRKLANASGAVVVSVDYHLAPEHRFPVQADEAHVALRWVADHAADFGADGARLAVAGDSAGGYMAATAAILARDRGGPHVAYQALVYPKVDAVGHYASFERYGEGFYLTEKLMRWFDAALHVDGASKASPYASPLREPLVGLPPATIVLAECDPLHDEGVAFAHALEAAGVPVELAVHAGMIHGFYSMGAVFPEATTAANQLGAALRAALRAP